MLSVLDGGPASGTYTLRVADDAVNNFGSFDSWSLLITSPTFPERYDGRALLACAGESLVAASGQADLELVGERPAHLCTEVLVVIDHEQPRFRAHARPFLDTLCIA